MYYAARFYDEGEYERTLDLFDSINVETSPLRKSYTDGIILFYDQDESREEALEFCREGDCDGCTGGCFDRGENGDIFKVWHLIDPQVFLEMYFHDKVEYVIRDGYEHEPDIVEEDISIMELLASC